MYEVKCPHCGHGTKASFVRVGAIAECEGCGAHFRVADKHIRKKMATRVGNSALKAEEILRARVGLSGLSDVMRRDYSDAPNADSSKSPKAPASRPDRPGAPSRHGIQRSDDEKPGSRREKKQRSRQSKSSETVNTRRLYLGAGVSMACIALLVGGWLFVFLGNQEPKTVPLTAGDPGLPNQTLRYGRLLDATEWTELHPVPYSPSGLAADVTMEDVRIDQLNNGWYSATGRLRFEQPGMIEHGVYYLVMVDRNGQQLFSTQLGVLMLNQDQARPFRVEIPPQIWRPDAGYRIEGWVNVVSQLDEPLLLTSEQVEVDRQPGSTEREQQLEVSVTLPAEGPGVNRLTFAIDGLGSAGEVVGSWRVDWPLPVSPGETVTFTAQLEVPPHRETPLGWRGSAVGKPVWPSAEDSSAPKDAP